MTTITTINASDQITNSRSDINTNFTNLNSGKIETSVIDTDTTLAANSDSKIATQKAVKAYVDSGGNSNASTTSRGLVEQATAAEISARATTGSSGAPLFVNPGDLGSVVKFGGTGADGALTVSSGTTTIDLGSVRQVIKNYTAISITGTGKIAFSNPHANGTLIILKSQGDVTLTSNQTPMINASTVGAAGSASRSGSDGGGTGTTADNGLISITGGADGVTASGTAAGGIKGTYTLTPADITQVGTQYIFVLPGAGGGTGSSNNAGGSSGAGGRGGAGLVIECGGAFNFTTTSGISVAGGNGGSVNTTAGAQGGGGGGGGGVCYIVYNTLTANTGTITVSGGVATSGNGTARGGGGGASFNNNGSNDGSTNTGGNGGDGLSLVSLNTQFA